MLAKLQNTGPLLTMHQTSGSFALTRISIIPRSFIHCRAKRAKRHEDDQANRCNVSPVLREWFQAGTHH